MKMNVNRLQFTKIFYSLGVLLLAFVAARYSVFIPQSVGTLFEELTTGSIDSFIWAAVVRLWWFY